jgi:hypothetical protein
MVSLKANARTFVRKLTRGITAGGAEYAFPFMNRIASEKPGRRRPSFSMLANAPLTEADTTPPTNRQHHPAEPLALPVLALSCCPSSESFWGILACPH